MAKDIRIVAPDGLYVVSMDATEKQMLALAIAECRQTLSILEKARRDPRILDTIATQCVNTSTSLSTLFVRRKNGRK